jgi:hypothetical protein
MKNYFLLIIILINVNSAFSQEYLSKVTEFDGNFVLDNESSLIYDIRPIEYNNELFCYSREIKRDSFGLHFYLRSRNRSYRIYCNNHDTANINYDLVVDGTLFNKFLFSLEFNGEKFELIRTLLDKPNERKTFLLVDFFNKIEVYQENILLMCSKVAGWNGDSLSPVYINIYDNELNLSRKKFFFPKGIRFLNYNPRQIIDFNSGQLLVSDITDYRIILYNLELNPIDSLVRKDLKFQDSDADKSQFVSTEGYHYISKALFIDSCNIIIARFERRKIDEFDHKIIYFFDIWSKTDGKWILKYKNLANDFLKYEDNYDPNRQKVTNRIFVGNGKLYTIERIPFKITDEDKKLTYSEFLRKRDKHLWEDKNTIYSVFIRKFK